MRRYQLIQLAVVVVALIFGYKFIDALISIMVTILFEFGDGLGSMSGFIYRYLIVIAIYCIGFFLLIKYNSQIANYVDKQGESGPNNSEVIKLNVQQSNLLFIVIIALCLITLLEEIPVIILSIYDYFKKEAGNFRNGGPADTRFKSAAVKFVFAMIILFCARAISEWFSKQTVSDKSLIETTGEPDDSNSLNL